MANRAGQDMAKATTPTPKTDTAKPARSKTRAAATKPRAVRKTVKPAVAKPVLVQSDPVVADAKPDVDALEISKKELIERLVENADMKKGEARRALDAVLSVLNGALAEGANISAAPLGKIKIARTKDTATGQLVVCRVKLKGPVTPDAS